MKHVSGSWHMMGYSLFSSAVYNISENMTNELFVLKVDNKGRNAEENSTDNLVNKIMTFAKEQTYLKVRILKFLYIQFFSLFLSLLHSMVIFHFKFGYVCICRNIS